MRSLKELFILDRETTIPIVRKIPFEFPEDTDPHWIPGEPELASMANGASLTMPYLEPFLIKTIRDSLTHIEDPLLREEIDGFAQQEAHHYQMHRKFNNLLKRKGYPELAHIEEQMKASYAKLSQRSLQVRMAYTAGFEAMTMGITKWLIGDRLRLFAGADPQATSFILWHMVEETEHKCVAYDAYKAVYGTGLKSYFYRMIGVFHGSLDVIRYSRKAYQMMLKKDGLWKSFRSRLRLAILKAGPFLLRAALPGHNPRHEKDLQWVTDWLEGYEKSDKSVAPLIDTLDPKMPVPFTT